jgi:hypothetical protein
MSLVTPPIENRAKTIATQIDQSRSFTINQLIRATKQTFKNVWFNPEVTPQEIFNEFGTNASIIFKDHAAAVQCVLTIDPTALDPADYTPPFAYTIKPDGSVTVGAPIVTETITPEPEILD